MRQDWLGSVYNVRKCEPSSMLLQGCLPSRLKNKVRLRISVRFKSERLGTGY